MFILNSNSKIQISILAFLFSYIVLGDCLACFKVFVYFLVYFSSFSSLISFSLCYMVCIVSMNFHSWCCRSRRKKNSSSGDNLESTTPGDFLLWSLFFLFLKVKRREFTCKIKLLCWFFFLYFPSFRSIRISFSSTSRKL